MHRHSSAGRVLDLPAAKMSDIIKKGWLDVKKKNIFGSVSELHKADVAIVLHAHIPPYRWAP